MQQELLRQIIEQGIMLIQNEQLSDGGFLHRSNDEFQYKTTFFTANILTCLNTLPEASGLKKIKKQAARFLLSQKHEGWSFNYWAHDAKERETMPYPDDLDDTFVALAALQGYDASLIDGAVLAAVAKILTAVEIAPGGPYKTWLVNSGASMAWKDVDIAANSNVGYFLKLIDISLPNLNNYIDEKIAVKDIQSPYYPSIVQLLYFISRFYEGDQKPALVEMIIIERNENRLWQNPLESAMAISALINLSQGVEIVEEDIIGLIKQIEREGWTSHPFCIDPQRDGTTYHAGARALTAAFCIEAFTKHILDNGRDCEPDVAGVSMLENIKSLAQDRVRKSFEGQSRGNLERLALKQIESIKNEEVILVPYITYEALGKPDMISVHVVEEFALANLYGWIAYTIYDDFLDGEGEPLMLSTANYFLRELTLIYCDIDKTIPGIRGEYLKIMNGVDDANTIEQMRCRSIKNLGDKSLGHALPAVAIMLAMGYSANSDEVQEILSFFRNYLIARQLHDDAHDWKEDLLRGQMNSVGVLLGQLFEKQHGITITSINSFEHIPELEKLFWRETVLEIIDNIKLFLDRARNDINGNYLFKAPEQFLKLFDRLDSAADRTLRERAEAIKFIDAYSDLELS